MSGQVSRQCRWDILETEKKEQTRQVSGYVRTSQQTVQVGHSGDGERKETRQVSGYIRTSQQTVQVGHSGDGKRKRDKAGVRLCQDEHGDDKESQQTVQV